MEEPKAILKKLTLEEKASLCSGRGAWHTKTIKRLGIPETMMCDGPVGLRKQVGKEGNLGINESVKTVCFPATATLAWSFDPQATAALGKTLGRECQSQNVQMLLGPGMNIKRNVLGGRNFEYYSEDPYLTGQLAAAYINGLQSTGVAACAKHFAGNSQETFRMSGNSIIAERPLHEIYLAAFEHVVKNTHLRSIMAAYNSLNGHFCSENKDLLTTTLRNKWGFSGMTVTDWGAVKDRVKGIQAGCDLEMPGGPGAQDDAIVAAVKDGRLATADLDKAVLNVLRFIKQAVDNRQTVTGNLDADHDLAVKLATQSDVLMQNKHNLLPLNKGQKVAFIGAFAQKPRFQGGGSSHVNAYKVSSALDYAKDQHLNINFVPGYDADSDDPDHQLETAAVTAAQGADVVVIFAGLPDRYETEGEDRTTMKMPANQNQLIHAISAVQPNTVVVLHTGSPVEMPWKDDVAAIMNMGLAGEGVGEATGQLLYGQANPSGHLTETYPQRLEDTSSYLNYPGEKGTVHYRENIFVGYRYYDKKKVAVNFPFGAGLSYTTFKFTNLTLSTSSMKDTDQATISCDVTNTGKQAGAVTAQLYIGCQHSAVLRPVRELKGFQKCFLKAGETQQITFILNRESFQYWNEQIHNWTVESGNYQLAICDSSRHLPLTGSITVIATTKLPIHYSIYTPIAEVIDHPDAKKELAKVMQHQVLKIDDQTLEAMDPQKRQKTEATIEGMLQNAASMTLMAMVSLGSMSIKKLRLMIDRLNSKEDA